MGFIKIKWQKIAGSIDEIKFGANGIATATLNGKSICIARNEERLYAFEYYCPHAGGVMAQGCLTKGGHITCPVHDIVFDMESGENVSGEGFQLETWKVKENSAGIFIGMKEEVGFWGLFGK